MTNEEGLITEAQAAISETNWTLGRLADRWLADYACGRSLEELANVLKTNSGWLAAYCRIYRLYHEIRPSYPRLRWVHFLMVEGWSNSQDALEWANANGATVGELAAWQRLQVSVTDTPPTLEPDAP